MELYQPRISETSLVTAAFTIIWPALATTIVNSGFIARSL